MRHPQVVVYESAGMLAWLLRPLCRERKWALREPRRPEACMRMLRRGGPAVLIVKLENDLAGEFALLEQTGWLFPHSSTVVVSDQEDVTLADLAWDLGAGFVLFPPQPRGRLVEVVAGMMTALIDNSAPAPHQPANLPTLSSPGNQVPEGRHDA